MPFPDFTGAEKAQLRATGQTLDIALKLGRKGVTPEVLREFERLLDHYGLVKVRLPGERAAREALAGTLAEAGGAAIVGGVGPNRLFYRPPVPGKSGD